MDNCGSTVNALTKIAVTIRSAFSKKQTYYYGLFAVVIITALWSIYTFNKTAPAQEGWYNVLADMVLAGKTPYVDFEFLYFPVYLYFFTGLVQLFGSSLFPLRILGIFVFIVSAVLIYKILSYFVPHWIAAVAAIGGAFFSIMDEFYISYDYHSWVYLVFLIAVYFLVKYIKTGCEKHHYLLISGIFVSLTILLRPQCGLILLCGIILYYILQWLLLSTKQKIIPFLCGVFIPVLIMVAALLASGLFDPFVNSVFNYSSKSDSFIHLAFSFFDHFASPYSLQIFIFPLFCLLFINKLTSEQESDSGKQYLIIFFVQVLIILLATMACMDLLTGFMPGYVVTRMQISTATIVIVLLIIFILLLLITCRIKRQQIQKFRPEQNNLHLFLLCAIASLAMIWGSGVGGAISSMYTGLCFAIIAAFLLSSLDWHRGLELPKIATVQLVVCCIFAAVTVKADVPYHWWDVEQQPYSEQTETIDLDYFENIRTSEDQKQFYENFKRIADDYLDSEDQVYCFPNNQIFYHLAGVIPQVWVPLNWIDVCTQKGLQKDLEYLKANNPKIIVFNNVGLNGIEQNEQYYHSDLSVHKEMYKWIYWCWQDPQSGYTVKAEYGQTYILVKTDV